MRGLNAGRAAVRAAPAGHPRRAARLSDLGAALQTRFRRTGVLADLDEAIDAGRAAVEATSPGHASRALHLANLGAAPQARYGQTGALADLDEAIQAGRAAAELTPPGHPGRGRAMSNLGNALRARFERTGMLADVDAAIDAGRIAVEAQATHIGLGVCSTWGTRCGPDSGSPGIWLIAKRQLRLSSRQPGLVSLHPRCVSEPRDPRRRW